jgi:hypothetical protein
MTLVRLVYASRFEDSKFNPSELARILESATRNNPEHNITGMLAFGDDHFLQCLEGSREHVNRLYAKIANDPRHSSIVLLDYEEIKEREFADWSMRMVMLTEKNAQFIRRYSVGTRFNPFEMSGASAYHLLCAIKAA